jgi:hypothetical protein
VASDAQHASRINMDVVPNTASTSGAKLDTSRQRSSIPIAAESLPQHQKGAEAEVWMYPSQQQFYNAMKRKVRLMHTAARRSTHWVPQHSCIHNAHKHARLLLLQHIKCMVCQTAAVLLQQPCCGLGWTPPHASTHPCEPHSNAVPRCPSSACCELQITPLREIQPTPASHDSEALHCHLL